MVIHDRTDSVGIFQSIILDAPAWFYSNHFLCAPDPENSILRSGRLSTLTF
jgi:hypothetical protein